MSSKVAHADGKGVGVNKKGKNLCVAVKEAQHLIPAKGNSKKSKRMRY